ncbi:MAG: GIY-YIG nuclease family protein [Elusimicrobiota bacterium]|nr:GIY-YIG nuclease family protein [Elusimicrobiota bacterium]
MHYVYFLKSKSKKFQYVGTTHNLKNRLKEHNTGGVVSTKPYIPLLLIYYEAYLDEKDAFRREHSLKHSGPAIGHLKAEYVTHWRGNWRGNLEGISIKL